MGKKGWSPPLWDVKKIAVCLKVCVFLGGLKASQQVWEKPTFFPTCFLLEAFEPSCVQTTLPDSHWKVELQKTELLTLWWSSYPKYGVPSLKLTYPLQIDPWERRFLLETIIFRGYVSFREGIPYTLSTHSMLVGSSCAFTKICFATHVPTHKLGYHSFFSSNSVVSKLHDTSWHLGITPLLLMNPIISKSNLTLVQNICASFLQLHTYQ